MLSSRSVTSFPSAVATATLFSNSSEVWVVSRGGRSLTVAQVTDCHQTGKFQVWTALLNEFCSHHSILWLQTIFVRLPRSVHLYEDRYWQASLLLFCSQPLIQLSGQLR